VARALQIADASRMAEDYSPKIGSLRLVSACGVEVRKRDNGEAAWLGQGIRDCRPPNTERTADIPEDCQETDGELLQVRLDRQRPVGRPAR